MLETPDTPDLRSRVIRGLGWKAFSQIAVQGMALVSTIVIAHLLTPSEVGLVAMASVFSTLAIILSDLALGAAIVQRETLTEEDRSTSFWMNVGVGVLLTVAGFFLAGPIASLYGEPDVEQLFQVISVVFILSTLGATHNALMIREMRFRSLEIRTVIASGVAGGVAIMAAFLGAGSWAIVAQMITITAVSTLLVWRAAHWRPRFLVSRQSARELTSFSKWIVGARLLSYLNSNADNYLVGRYVGSAALGAYQIAYNVMLVPITRLAGPVQEVIYPAISKIREPRRVGEAWLRATTMVSLITVPAFAGMAVVAEDFVAVVLGDQWDDAVPVLQILCWVGIVQSVLWQIAVVLQALDRNAWGFRFTVVATAVTITAYVIGVQWGIVGVAVSSAVAATVLAPYYLSLPLRATGVRALAFLGAIAGVLEASAVMGLVLLALRTLALDSLSPALRLVILVAAGLAIYLPLAGWRVPEAVQELRALRRRGGPEEGEAVAS
ncbi:MAG TPA: MOP flippase family protein [Gaiellaceae bacterium]|nr:MOP flippase family protein [Gaiellaceae bacterium]